MFQTGVNNNIYFAQGYHNDGSGAFSLDGSINLPGVWQGSAAWGDYDNDGRLDLLLTGATNLSGSTLSQLYHNVSVGVNTAPAAPTGLGAAGIATGTATLTWAAAGDVQTTGAGLSYNLRVGTTPGGSNVVNPQANPGDRPSPPPGARPGPPAHHHRDLADPGSGDDLLLECAGSRPRFCRRGLGQRVQLYD